ncbi:MAG: hypothetical protein KAU44_01910 [Candidatus Marinimicrobia bacterium]|nr:hypothetical protein [Candidatus Neomarinimicrobiota bacterium]
MLRSFSVGVVLAGREGNVAGWLHADNTLPRVIPDWIRDLSVYAIQNRYLLRYLNSRPTQIFISFVSKTKNRIDTEILK